MGFADAAAAAAARLGASHMIVAVVVVVAEGSRSRGVVLQLVQMMDMLGVRIEMMGLEVGIVFALTGMDAVGTGGRLMTS